MKRLLLIAAATLLLLNAVALVATASEEGNRRVDTGNVVKADQGEGEHEAGGEEKAAAEGEKEAHQPAWMFTGWQTVFTILAVLYYAIAVKILPLIMAKEEEGHH